MRLGGRTIAPEDEGLGDDAEIGGRPDEYAGLALSRSTSDRCRSP